MSDPLDALKSVDASKQASDVMALPDHLRDALWRVESAKLEEAESPGGVIVCGMGGSAIGGDLAAAALGDRASRPITVVRGYGLPSWTTPDTLILCSSYSGDTEETVACYAAAEALGAKRIVATTGGKIGEMARGDGVPVIGLPAGLQPRAAVAYMFTCASEVTALAGAGPRINTEIDASAAHLERVGDELNERAAALAADVEGSIPVIYGSDLTAPVAYRWKCQVNENSKLPAFSAVLPEMDHNEIAGWEGAEGRFSAVFLGDSDQHPRERQRFELTAKLIEPHAHVVVQLEPQEGGTRTERLFSLVMLGDLVSLHLAALRELDPTPVEVVERLKDELGRP